MKMHMDESEILISYRNAKNQSEQISVLADLNACTRTEMAQWLTDHGEHVDGRALRYSKKKDPDSKSEPEAVVDESIDVTEEELEVSTEDDHESEIIFGEGELPNVGVMLTDAEVESLVYLIKIGLLGMIRDNPDFEDIEDLQNIMSAYGKMCHARVDM